MSRLFITPREINFINDIGKEIVKDVIGQKIYYFPISEIKSKVHDIYEEAEDKIFENPIYATIGAISAVILIVITTTLSISNYSQNNLDNNLADNIDAEQNQEQNQDSNKNNFDIQRVDFDIKYEDY